MRKDDVTVSRFMEASQGDLGLELIAGEAGVGNRIGEAAINRAGLALTGFFKHFAQRRIQVIGLAEHTYLSSLDKAQRKERLSQFFDQKIPCVVVTRAKGVFPKMRRLGEDRSVPVLRSDQITKHFVNGATLVMENLMEPREIVQGTMVEILGMGVLIEGRPGVGKSETALALIKRGHALVSDDTTLVRLDSSGWLMTTSVSAVRYHMEIRGLNIIHVPSLFGVASVREVKRLDMVATLIEQEHFDRPIPSDAPPTRKFLGVEVPQVIIPVAAGRDLAGVIETAALDLKLKKLGHDAAKELDAKLIARLTQEGKAGSE